MAPFLISTALIAGMSQGQVETLCAIVEHRQTYRGEKDSWAKAWIYLSFGGADLRPQDKAEIKTFCRNRKGARHG